MSADSQQIKFYEYTDHNSVSEALCYAHNKAKSLGKNYTMYFLNGENGAELGCHTEMLYSKSPPNYFAIIMTEPAKGGELMIIDSMKLKQSLLKKYPILKILC